MFSSRKFVQYVHNDGCGCHKVPRLPLNTVNVSCMQMEGVELCTKVGALTVVFGRVAFYLPVQKFNLSSYRIYILKNFSLLNSLTLIQPLQILLCCAAVALCVNAMHWGYTKKKKKKKTTNNDVYRIMPHTNQMSICYCVC